MSSDAKTAKPRKTPWILGTLVVSTLATLVILQSTNLWKEFSIESSSDLLLLYGLSSLNFVAFIIFAFIFLRSIIKLMRERRTLELGSQIKSRLLIYFFAVSLLPIIAMAIFSYLFMNRALERWFTQIPVDVIREAREVQKQSLIDRVARLDDSVRMIAAAIDQKKTDRDELERIAAAGNLVYIAVLSGDQALVSYERSVPADQKKEIDRLIALAHSNDRTDPTTNDGRGFDIAVSDMSDGRRLAVVPDPFGERGVSQVVESSVLDYERLKQKQINVRQVGLLTLGVLTFLLLFASSWIAIHLARGLTAPIKALAEAADEIAQGNFSHRVDVFAEDELAILVSIFNDMTAKLESSSIELRERRRYIETVLETLPTGVISVDAVDNVSTINSAAVNILKLADEAIGIPFSKLIHGENHPIFDRLIARARRVGRASDQTVLHTATNTDGNQNDELTVAVTATTLPNDVGVVLVIEDLSELIAAQRSSAWQEVARRMAHEIKNPLTPIQLSAERIAKRFVDADHRAVVTSFPARGNVGNVVQESTATILREVTSLKTMVDEFSRFARLPATELKSANLNDVIRTSAAAFSDRLFELAFDLDLDENLPPVLLDSEQLRRVFVNLIENAIEAFDANAADKRITISTRYETARDLVVTEVADNGRGINPSDFQKLFQPYFSTKGRGTGLGLAIVNRIINDHHGRIKVVANQPQGARFIIELPANA